MDFDAIHIQQSQSFAANEISVTTLFLILIQERLVAVTWPEPEWNYDYQFPIVSVESNFRNGDVFSWYSVVPFLLIWMTIL